MILSQEERIEKAGEIMKAFARRTGLEGGAGQGRRYLWTDAYAVCNFLSLYERSGERRHLDLARTLIDAVHRELGRFREDDERHGPLSGLSEADAASYPTVGGLRIGKVLPERGGDEPYDEQKEWDRDGQYFHYLTKWMHALDQMAAVSGEVKYSRWAVELAKSAHRAFTYTTPDGSKRMYWKMSTDLTRPLVPSMGQHDALDAYVTYLQLSVTARELGDDAGMGEELEAAAAMAEAMPLATEDPLGLGGLLSDAGRVTQLLARHGLPLRGLLRALLEAAREGTERYAQSDALRHPAMYRLAFRELGLGIGLHGVSLMETLNASLLENDVLAEQLGALQAFVPLAEVLEMYWMRPEHQNVPTWHEHEDINAVMLSTSLLPDRFLAVGRERDHEPS
jgi:hypothetical protein